MNCPKCSKTFTNKSNLNQHFRRKIPCNNVIKCYRCLKVFKTNQELKTHMKRKTLCKIIEINIEDNIELKKIEIQNAHAVTMMNIELEKIKLQHACDLEKIQLQTKKELDIIKEKGVERSKTIDKLTEKHNLSPIIIQHTVTNNINTVNQITIELGREHLKNNKLSIEEINKNLIDAGLTNINKKTLKDISKSSSDVREAHNTIFQNYLNCASYPQFRSIFYASGIDKFFAIKYNGIGVKHISVVKCEEIKEILQYGWKAIQDQASKYNSDSEYRGNEDSEEMYDYYKAYDDNDKLLDLYKNHIPENELENTCKFLFDNKNKIQHHTFRITDYRIPILR